MYRTFNITPSAASALATRSRPSRRRWTSSTTSGTPSSAGANPACTAPSFGDAWLDGVDLFLEHGTDAADRYDVLALELAKHNIRGGPGKPLHLTATPAAGSRRPGT